MINNILKKIFLGTITFSFFLLVFVTFVKADTAPAYIPLTTLPGITSVNPGAGTNSGGLSSYLGNMYTLGIMIATALAVIMIMWGGIEYMSTDSIGGKEGGKEKVTNALFGLLLALASWLILNTINHQLILTNLTIAPVKPQSDKPEVTASSSQQKIASSQLLLPGDPGYPYSIGDPNYGQPFVSASGAGGPVSSQQGTTFQSANTYYYSSSEAKNDSGTLAGKNAYDGQLVANPNNDPFTVGSAASSYYPGGTIIYNNNTGTYWVVDDNNINSKTGLPVNNTTTNPNAIEYYNNQSDPGYGQPSKTSFTVVYQPSSKLSSSQINGLHNYSTMLSTVNGK